MAMGERIRFFRKLRGWKLKELGQAVGFPESSADVRTAQYESGSRTPKADITNRLADVLDVSPQALTVPDIDSGAGLMHTLFTLEDTCGLTVTELDGQIVLCVDAGRSREADELRRMLCAWQAQAAKLEAGEIAKEDYDRWRYHYPESDAT
ncbi:MAG: helix-turn-helix domain-containing protein [Clostridiales bacterium]|nr:helix-turn-helix domain-containing protein [Clostridiales bacterium]